MRKNSAVADNLHLELAALRLQSAALAAAANAILDRKSVV